MEKLIKYGILYLYVVALIICGTTIKSHCKRGVVSPFVVSQPEFLRDSRERAIEIIHCISIKYQKATLDNSDKSLKVFSSTTNQQEEHIIPEIKKIECKLPDFQLLHPISYYIYSLHKIRT